jgi:hypothetical protein
MNAEDVMVLTEAIVNKAMRNHRIESIHTEQSEGKLRVVLNFDPVEMEKVEGVEYSGMVSIKNVQK